MNVALTFRKLAKIAAVAVAVLPSLVQAFIPLHEADGSVHARLAAPTAGQGLRLERGHSCPRHNGGWPPPAPLVHAIVDNEGDIVNRYAYDSFGVIDWDYSYETVPNRYTFQGREYDHERGDYYFRNRVYVPEWGLFSGPDMNLAAGPYREPHGLMSYVFCGNDPWRYADPLGLYWQRNANGKWEWVSGSSCILEDMVSPGIDTIAQIGQAVPDIWCGLWGGLQNIRIPESQGNGFVSTAWNGVAGAGNAILAPLATTAEPRPQDYDDGLLMLGEAFGGSGRSFGDRLKLGGIGAFVFVGSALDVMDFVPDPVDAMQKSAREAGLGMMRRSSKTDDKHMGFIADPAPTLAINNSFQGEFISGWRALSVSDIPLPSTEAKTFLNNRAVGRVLSNDTLFYRVSGGSSGRVGSYLTRTKPSNVGEAVNKLALNPDWGVEGVHLSEVIVPKGTVIWEGKAARQGKLVGGGNQVWVSSEQLSESWFRFIDW